MVFVAPCATCKHYDHAASKAAGFVICAAFPAGGVPREIELGYDRHTAPVEGDHGIQYEDRDDVRRYREAAARVKPVITDFQPS